MTKTFTKILLTGFILISIHALTSSYSNTGASIIANNSISGCGCHGAANANTIISVLGIPTSGYGYGQVYPVSIAVENPTKVAAGINFSVSIGTISNLSSNLSSVSATAGRHDGPASMTGGIAIFTFDWTAPASGTATLNLNVSANAVDGTGGTTGDAWNNSISSAPLSLDKLKFTALPTANQVTLNWETTDEAEIQSFVIERSEDANKFDSLSVVIANGSNNLGAKYDYADKPLYSNEYFYRIKVIGKSGEVDYSSIAKVSFNNGAAFTFVAYPVPAKQSEFINLNVFNNVGKLITVNVFNKTGNLVYTSRETAKKATNYLMIKDKLPAGLYIVELVQENGKKVIKKVTVQ